MKISSLQKLAWVFFALALTTTTVFGQGWGNRNRANFNQNANCLNNISGLTEKQQTQIQEMEVKHREGMDELRNKRQSTISAIEKSEIRTEMLKKVDAHRKEVKGVLTDDQQKQYDQLHTYGNYGRTQRFANKRGNQNFAGRGNGGGNVGRGNRNGTCYANANFCRRSGNFQNGNGRGNANRNFNGRNGNNFRGRNANYGRGNGRYCGWNSSTNVN